MDRRHNWLMFIRLCSIRYGLTEYLPSPSRATLWPDDFRDEVLARLLELNRQRAEEERLSAAAEAGRVKVRKKSTAGRKVARKNPDQPEFFES